MTMDNHKERSSSTIALVSVNRRKAIMIAAATGSSDKDRSTACRKMAAVVTVGSTLEVVECRTQLGVMVRVMVRAPMRVATIRRSKEVD